MPSFLVEGSGYLIKMMEPSFEKLLGILAKSGVRLILVGGVAVTLHGYARLTEDVDILVDAAADNIQLLLATLADFGEGFAKELSVSDFDDSEGAIRIIEESEHCQIDIFTRMTGRNYHDVSADADVFLLNGRKVLYASKAALIQWKQGSFREKDRLDVIALRNLIKDPRCLD
jgi:hypothetical protein